MPNPSMYKEKDQKHFMQQCMHQTLHKEKKSPEQSAAICLNLWRNRKMAGRIIQGYILNGGFEAPILEDKPPRSDQTFSGHIKAGQPTSGQFQSPEFKSDQIRSGGLPAKILSAQELIKKSNYPTHPASVVISKNELLSGSKEITEEDIWNYYDGVKSKMLPELKGKDLFVGIKLEGKKGKPLYLRHPFDKKTEFIRISNEKDFMKTVTGRTVEIHQTMGATTPYWVVDFDGIPGDNFEKTKKITGEVADKLEKTPEIRKVQIRYSGKRGFHILCFLKKEQPIDKAREDLKKWLKENFSDHKDVVLAETAQGSRGALGISPMKFRGGQVALWSMRVTGLCCVEVPRAELAGFKREDARPEKVYKKLTGKTFQYGSKMMEKKACKIVGHFDGAGIKEEAKQYMMTQAVIRAYQDAEAIYQEFIKDKSIFLESRKKFPDYPEDTDKEAQWLLNKLLVQFPDALQYKNALYSKILDGLI